MSNNINVDIANKEAFGNIEWWKYEDGFVIIDDPNSKIIIKADKKDVLGTFLEKFSQNIEYQGKIRNLSDFIIPLIKDVIEIESTFIAISETRNVMEVVILLNIDDYIKTIARKIFNIRLEIENKYSNYEVEFVYFPKFKANERDIISKEYTKIFP